MTPLPVFVQSINSTTWSVTLWIQPGAKKTEPMGIFDNKLKLRLNAPPVEGKANTALIKYLSKTLAIRQSKISLQAGALSRHKTIHIESDTMPDWSKLVADRV